VTTGTIIPMRVLKHFVFLGFVAALVAAAPPMDAQAASPAGPVLSITSTVAPTHIVPGSTTTRYSVIVTNVGGSATAPGEPIVITDNLPAGFSPLAVFLSNDQEHEIPTCVAEPEIATCEAPTTLQPGELLRMGVVADVPVGASGVAVNRVKATGGGSPEASAAESAQISFLPAPFGIQASEATFDAPDGTPFTQSGGHPFRFYLRFQTNTYKNAVGNSISGTLKRVQTTLPPGMVVDPAATPVRCTTAELEGSGAVSQCPDASAVGLVHVTINTSGSPSVFFSEPVYNMVPPLGSAADLAFNVAGFGLYVHLLGGINAAGDYQLTAAANDVTQHAAPSGVNIELWGKPSDEIHDFNRGECGYGTGVVGSCPTERLNSALLTMPSSCSVEPLATTLSTNSWESPDAFVTAEPSTIDSAGNPVGLSGCGALEFAPSISVQPTTGRGESPTGLNVTIHQPQNNNYEELSTANLKDVKVTLPSGVALNPSAGNGLGACSNAQIGYQPFDGKIRFTEAPQTCPDSAKLGTLEVNTPLLNEKLPGTIYLAKPFENPFGNLTAIYLAIESPKLGIIVKLGGKVELDPKTGQVTATFTENPELPIEDIETHFFQGDRAALMTPLTCGSKTTAATLTPWSTPEGVDAHLTSSFETNASCFASEGAAPKSFSFTAGTETPVAGAYSPFVLRLTRPDGSQRITRIDTSLPEGLFGKLAGVPYCPESAIALAKSRERPEAGKEEQASPSCPAASEVGSVHVTAGAGSMPVPVSGRVYLAGPYKGAPLSLVVIVPAVAGPFDLGNVVTRVALNVGLYDIQVQGVSDPLPTIIDGIPLDVRSIELNLKRPNFTLNPTSCEAKEINGSVATQAGQTASVSSRFQVGGCEKLKYKPGLKLSLKGSTRRAGHPGLEAVVTAPQAASYANTARIQVGLPHSEFLDQGNLNKVCTQPQLASATCPKQSVYGHVKVWTPLFEKPLEGNVYIGVGFGHKLPDLVTELNGQVRVLLHGRVDTTKQHGLRNTFEFVPDAPYSKVVLNLKGGKKYGLLENSENLCAKPQTANVRFTAQNGLVEQLHPRIANGCKPKGKKNKK
jgi:Domain of unknown function DUF11